MDGKAAYSTVGEMPATPKKHRNAYLSSHDIVQWQKKVLLIHWMSSRPLANTMMSYDTVEGFHISNLLHFFFLFISYSKLSKKYSDTVQYDHTP